MKKQTYPGLKNDGCVERDMIQRPRYSLLNK
jgi:hypothetical protein